MVKYRGPEICLDLNMASSITELCALEEVMLPLPRLKPQSSHLKMGDNSKILLRCVRIELNAHQASST